MASSSGSRRPPSTPHLRRTSAERFRPDRIKTLFVAEAPPESEDRYFYFPWSHSNDWLWLGMMKAIYPGEFGPTAQERLCKEAWLERFREDGFFLIDLSEIPIPLKSTTSQRLKILREAEPNAFARIDELAPERIILVKKTVFDVLAEPLKSSGHLFDQTVPLPFPGSGQQSVFHERLTGLLRA